MTDLLFFTLALLSIVGAIGMISFLQPIYAALSFIITLIALAGIYALLGSSFLFAIQIIIYAGAIISLILFIIMFLNIQPKNLPKEPHKTKFILLSLITVTPFAFFLIQMIKSLPLIQSEKAEQFGTIKSVGKELFSDYVLPFEMVSILLIVSLVGAVILANKQGEDDVPA
ncbi:MAG: NADH-quinone oxidoreductase subunit J [Thiovulaceae bacterium]|nr:NADH-quinone oxidoreductase subunit J [Sulfurimonadaceae bacterium]